MELKRLTVAALGAVLALSGIGSILAMQSAPRAVEAVNLSDDREPAIRRDDDDGNAIEVVSDDDVLGDGDATAGDDGTNGGANTGDGDATAGDNGTNGGANTGDGDATAGDDGTSGGANTGDGDRTAGDDGTSGGNNTGDGDNTAGNDGTSGGNNTRDTTDTGGDTD